MYISEVGKDILNWDIIVPEFFNKDKFRINKEIILNKITKEHLLEPKFEYIFKCIFFSFKYKLKEPIGIITGNLLNIFNKFIDDIGLYIDTFLNKKSEKELNRRGLVDFSDFMDVSYDVDGTGDVYPDIYDEIKKGGEEKKKKKSPLKTPLK